MSCEFQYGTWIPTLQIGNGIIKGQYTDQTGHWTRVGHQIFITGFFRLNYNKTDVDNALAANTTVQEVRLGTLPYESNSGSSIFNLSVSNNHFIHHLWLGDTTGARSIWGSPRMRVFANVNALSKDLSIGDLSPSTSGVFTEVRVSGVYTAFPDLSTTDPVNTPPPTIIGPPPTQPPPSVIDIGSIVHINQTAQTWATGQTIPSWAKGHIYTVTATRKDKTELLLDYVNSWIKSHDVTLV